MEEKSRRGLSCKSVGASKGRRASYAARLRACCRVSPRAAFAGSWGEGESGCTAQTGEPLGWLESQGGGVGRWLRGCLGVRLQPEFTAGKEVSRVHCPVCRFPIYTAKNSLFEWEKSWTTNSWKLGEYTDAVLLSVCSAFLFPLLFGGDRWRKQGRRHRPVVWSRVLLLHSSKTKSWLHGPTCSHQCYLTATNRAKYLIPWILLRKLKVKRTAIASHLRQPSLSQKWRREAAKHELLFSVVRGRAPGLLKGEMQVRGRKERGSKKGRMGSKEGQRAKVLHCDTKERK